MKNIKIKITSVLLCVCILLIAAASATSFIIPFGAVRADAESTVVTTGKSYRFDHASYFSGYGSKDTWITAGSNVEKKVITDGVIPDRCCYGSMQSIMWMIEAGKTESVNVEVDLGDVYDLDAGKTKVYMINYNVRDLVDYRGHPNIAPHNYVKIYYAETATNGNPNYGQGYDITANKTEYSVTHVDDTYLNQDGKDHEEPKGGTYYSDNSSRMFVRYIKVEINVTTPVGSSIEKRRIYMGEIYAEGSISDHHYIVHYEANGGTGSVPDTEHAVYSAGNISTLTYSKTGYTFAGWNVSRASDGKKLYYKTTDHSDLKWFDEGSEDPGYELAVIGSGHSDAGFTSSDDDVITCSAVWESAPVSYFVRKKLYDARGSFICNVDGTANGYSGSTVDISGPDFSVFTYNGGTYLLSFAYEGGDESTHIGSFIISPDGSTNITLVYEKINKVNITSVTGGVLTVRTDEDPVYTGQDGTDYYNSGNVLIKLSWNGIGDSNYASKRLSSRSVLSVNGKNVCPLLSVPRDNGADGYCIIINGYNGLDYATGKAATPSYFDLSAGDLDISAELIWEDNTTGAGFNFRLLGTKVNSSAVSYNGTQSAPGTAIRFGTVWFIDDEAKANSYVRQPGSADSSVGTLIVNLKRVLASSANNGYAAYISEKNDDLSTYMYNNYYNNNADIDLSASFTVGGVTKTAHEWLIISISGYIAAVNARNEESLMSFGSFAGTEVAINAGASYCYSGSDSGSGATFIEYSAVVTGITGDAKNTKLIAIPYIGRVKGWTGTGTPPASYVTDIYTYAAPGKPYSVNGVLSNFDSEIPDITGMTSDNARNAVESLGYTYEETLVYSETVAFGLVISYSPSGVRSLDTTINAVISKGTAYASVPNVTGMTREVAQTAIENAGFVFSETQDYSETVASGRVISYSPTGSALLGTTVNVVVSKGSEYVTVPNVTGMTKANAKTAIESAGFIYSESYDYSSTVAVNRVISYLPTGSAKIGSTINVVVNDGKKIVPDLSGKSRLQAETAIADAGFVAAVTTQRSETVTRNKVISQNKTAGSRLTAGSTITVTISDGGVPSGGASNWISSYGTSGDTVLMTESEILAHNDTIRTKCNNNASANKKKMYVMHDPANYTGKTLGIVTSRGNLKTVYNATESDSNTQDAELMVGWPVYILSERGDRYEVQCHHYYGWVLKTCIAKTTDLDLWLSFANPSDFVVIIDKNYTVNNQFLDMSCKLPYIGETGSAYKVKLPTRNSSTGMLSSTSSYTIPFDKGSHGYLPYTKNNVVIQAFKVLGLTYGWGGINNLTDCSGYVGDIYRCFGFIFPRDTGEQCVSVGLHVLNVSGNSDSVKSSKLDQYESPYPIYMSGHVVLYLGKLSGTRYIIHQNGTDKAVGYGTLASYYALSKFTYFDPMIP